MVEDGNAARRASSAPGLVVFDVGGVFIDLDLEARRRILTGGGRPEHESQAALAAASAAFRLGRITSEDYADQVARACAITREDVIVAETALLSGILPEMIAYARSLRPHHRVVCLSNTQAIHWRHIIEHMLGEAFFDACYLSHEMGMEKPGDDVYRAVQEREKRSGSDIIFIDDTLENIAGARRCGWVHSIHHRTADTTIAAVKDLLHPGADRKRA